MIHRPHVHLVFVTKHRRGVITDNVRAHLETSMRKVCQDFDCELLALDGEDDHIHILVAYSPKLSLARLVNSLKGVSARRIRALDLPEVRGKLWGNAFWSPSYCAISCGGAPLDIIKAYIQTQRSPAQRRRTTRRPPA